MAIFTTAEGTVEVPDVAIRAAVRNAQFRAEITAAALDLMGFGPRKGESQSESKFPAGFLLELGALAQLKIWELTGIRDFLNADLPTFAEAVADLHARALNNPSQFRSYDMPLSQRVFKYWFKNMSWDAPMILRAEVLVGPIDEDALVDAMANLLWAHRHDSESRN